MNSDDFVSVKELAQRLGMDRSHARRYVLKLGYSFHKRRTPDSGSQLTLCVTESEAAEIAAHRANQGFTASTIVTREGAFTHLDVQQQLALGIDRSPHPVGGSRSRRSMASAGLILPSLTALSTA
jgi:hypothetical protein